MLRSWFIAGLAATISHPVTAQAQPNSMCASYDKIVERMAEFGEMPLLSYSDEAVIKIFFVNPADESWTLVSLDGRGYACTMRAGVGYQLHEPGEPA
jgi:hypothetical protein